MRIEEENNDIDIIDALKTENDHLVNENLELENQIGLLKQKSATHSNILIFLVVFSIIALLVIMFGVYKISKLSSEQEFGKKTLSEQRTEIDDHKKEIKNKSDEVEGLRGELEECQSKIEEMTEEIDNLKSSLSEKDNEIEELNNKLSEYKVSETNEF